MNEEDLPSLRLSSRYRRMLASAETDKEVKDYVKERFRSAMQLLRTSPSARARFCAPAKVIVRRQQEFLDAGSRPCGR